MWKCKKCNYISIASPLIIKGFIKHCSKCESKKVVDILPEDLTDKEFKIIIFRMLKNIQNYQTVFLEDL